MFPRSSEDRRRWIGGIVCSLNVCPQKTNVNILAISCSLSLKLPRKIYSDMEKTLEDNPYLTTRQIVCGQGIGYRPGSADTTGTIHMEG